MTEDQVLDVEPGDLHLGELELDQLAVADGLAPEDAVARVVDRPGEALLDHAEGHGGHAGPFGHEVPLGRVATGAVPLVLGLAEQVLPADPDVGQEELAGGGRMEAHLGEGPGLLEAGHPLLQDEREHRAVADRGVRTVVELGVEDDGVGVGAVGDVGLVAVEDVLVPVTPGRGGHAAEGIRPGVGLGDRPGADLLGGEQVEPPPLHLCRRPLFHDRAGGQPDAHSHRGHDPRAVVAELDDRDQGHRRRPPVARPPGSFPLGRTGAGGLALELDLEAVAGHLVHPEGRVQLADDVVGGHVAVFEGVDVGDHLGLDEPADRVAHHQVLLGPLEQGGTSLWPLRAGAGGFEANRPRPTVEACE